MTIFLLPKVVFYCAIEWAFKKNSTTSLNIVSVEEMAEFIGLSFKYNSQFVISTHTSTSKNEWYWFSFRLKIPDYNVVPSKVKKTNLMELLNNSMMDGFSQRVCFLLMFIDEMGFQYYSGVNNVTMDDMTYHFNYFILLNSVAVLPVYSKYAFNAEK